MRNTRAAVPGHRTCEITILIVDDDEDMRTLARIVLERAGIAVAAEASDGRSALDQLDRLDPPPIPTVILLDIQMPGSSGLDIAADVLARLPDQLIVLYSAFLNDDIESRAAALGVAACVSKSRALELGSVIRELVEAA